MDLQAMLRKIDANKVEIAKRRPLKPEEIKELDAYFRIGLTYTSNAIEGNSLTVTETKVLLEDGITVGGKPVKDCYEATGHATAYDFMLKIARSGKLVFSEEMILNLHRLFYFSIDNERAGKYRESQVFITGTDYVPPTPAETPKLMSRFIQDLNTHKDSLHPVRLAAFAHKKIVDIHPFVDGNGRTARLLMNLILINKGYQIVTIPPILRMDYINALKLSRKSQNPSDIPFITFIAECEIETQKEFCRMFGIEFPGKNNDTRER
jgi:Fic family protein